MILVLDASLVVDFLLHRAPYYDSIKARMLSADSLAAPHLLDIEVTQVLRRFVLRGDISQQRAREAIQDLLDLPIQRYPHSAFLQTVFDLKDTLTAYDALYLVLANTLNAELLTRDSAFGQYNSETTKVTVVYK